MRPALARLVETLPAVTAVGTLAAVVLLAILGPGSLVPVAAAVGWLFLTPLAGILVYVLGVTGDESDDLGSEIARAARTEVADRIREGDATRGSPRDDSPDDDPLDTLRDRYARGEIDEIEFERRLERLLETEDVDVPPGVTLDGDPTEDRAAETVSEREPARER
jgi:hypothetical protein